jgi:hypothetical protein
VISREGTPTTKILVFGVIDELSSKAKDVENTIVIGNVQLAIRVTDILRMLRTMQGNLAALQADIRTSC